MNQALEHPFNNCGVAPFEFAGYAERLYWPCKDISGNINTSVPPMAGGTCAHCGACIRNAYIIKDATGKCFDVGCDCLEKLSIEPRIISAALAKKKVIDRLKRKEKAASDLATFEPQYEAVKAVLVTMPHPSEFWARNGRTLADYYDYCLRGCVASGKVKHMKAAIKAAKAGA